MNNVVSAQPAVMEIEPDKVLPLLQIISDLVGKRCDRFLGARYGLTMPQYQLLQAAISEVDSTLGGLSEHLNCSRGNVTGIVDRLERDGWLQRQRSTEDRRVIMVRLTDKGNGVGEISKELSEELANLSQVWDATQRQSLSAILLRMYTELKD